MLYAHKAEDIQSRSDSYFEVRLRLQGLAAGTMVLTEYRFDKDHNSYYRRGVELRDRAQTAAGEGTVDAEDVDALVVALRSGDLDAQLAALSQVPMWDGVLSDPQIRVLAQTAFEVYHSSQDPALRAAIEMAGKALMRRPEHYTPAEAAEIRSLSKLHSTASSIHEVAADGTIHLRVRLAGNGANILHIAKTP
jgi:hypothetical protein